MPKGDAKEGYLNTNAHLEAKVAMLERDLDEQCRLLGMGSSREARLMARMTRMVDLMRKLREPDWHIESIREFQCELSALESAAMSDESALREMIEAAKAEERGRISRLVAAHIPQPSPLDSERTQGYYAALKDIAEGIAALPAVTPSIHSGCAT